MNTIKLNTIGERPIKKGGASGGGDVVFYNVKDYDDEMKGYLISYAFIVKKVDFRLGKSFTTAADVFVEGLEVAAQLIKDIEAIGICRSLKVTAETDELVSSTTYIQEAAPDIKEISEAEFYSQEV